MHLIINKWVTAVKVSNFSGHYLCNRSTLDIGVLGYIGIVWPKEHSPEVSHIPPVTLCIWHEMHQFYVQSEQFSTCLLVLADKHLHGGLHLQHFVFQTIHKIVKNSTHHRRFMVKISFLITRCGTPVVCRRLLYTPYFKCSHRKKSVTVRSGGRGWKCCSSLINTLRTGDVDLRF